MVCTLRKCWSRASPLFECIYYNYRGKHVNRALGSLTSFFQEDQRCWRCRRESQYFRILHPFLEDLAELWPTHCLAAWSGPPAGGRPSNPWQGPSKCWTGPPWCSHWLSTVLSFVRDKSRGLDGGAFFEETFFNRENAKTANGKDTIDDLMDSTFLIPDVFSHTWGEMGGC